MRFSQGAKPRALFCLFCCLFNRIYAATDFQTCKNNFLEEFHNNTSPSNFTHFDPVFRGTPRWFHEYNSSTEHITSDSFLVLTYEGCKTRCGKWPKLNSGQTVFSVLTTWVLPMLALFSNLPFESISKKKLRHTLEALVNWIGSPQSAFTTTMFNIYQIQECKNHVRSGPLRQNYMDSYFVLSCINQYYYPRYATTFTNKVEAKKLEERRNLALFYGLFRPLSMPVTPNEKTDIPQDINETRFLVANLANHLRMLRRRGVIPMTISIVWFFIAFIMSLVQAFGSVGDSTAGHSLGLGMGLSWLPALVFMTIVDRNPISPTRCKVLIERWLYNVESIINHNEALEDLSPQSASGIATGAPPIQWWKPEAEPLELVVGDFVGSGRRLRHCGVTNTVLDRLDHRPGSNPRRWRYDDEIQAYKDLATDFEKDLVKRPLSWCACWFCGWIFVSVGISMAIMISFTTGTVGMGCLALLWLIFWNISSVSWYFQAMFQEPPRMVRWVSTGVNSISFLLLLTIMILQTMGGLNSCLCKSSFFALGWGGYMDFEDATFHTKIYPHIRPSWITAAVIGPLGALTAIFWTFRRWQRSSELWKVDEETTDLLNPLRRPEDGEERQWRDGSDPVYWLI